MGQRLKLQSCSSSVQSYLMIGATPLPAQIMPLPSSSRLGIWGERRPPTTLESAIMVPTLASVFARLLLVRRSSARLLWSKKMSLGLNWLASFLPKERSLRAKPGAVADSDDAVVQALQLPGLLQFAAWADNPTCAAEASGCVRRCAPGRVSLLQHQMNTS